MGVDFYVCSYCDEIFSDCECYLFCEDCGNKICSFCREKRKELKIKYLLKKSPTEKELENDWAKCPFCNYEIITDDMVLRYLLKRTGLSREEAEQYCRRDLKDIVN